MIETKEIRRSTTNFILFCWTMVFCAHNFSTEQATSEYCLEIKRLFIVWWYAKCTQFLVSTMACVCLNCCIRRHTLSAFLFVLFLHRYPHILHITGVDIFSRKKAKSRMSGVSFIIFVRRTRRFFVVRKRLKASLYLISLSSTASPLSLIFVPCVRHPSLRLSVDGETWFFQNYLVSVKRQKARPKKKLGAPRGERNPFSFRERPR